MTRRAAERLERATPQRRRLALVRAEDDNIRRRIPWLVVLSLVCVFTVIFGVLLARVVLVKSSFKLQKLQSKLVKAEERHEELLLEAAKKESPARIEREARAMGMLDPASVSYIVADVPRRAESRFAYGTLPKRVPKSTTIAAFAEESP